MKATELRIGNWVRFRHTETPVRITLGDFVREYKEEHLEDYEPIQLTEEWLVKFGFKYNESDDWFVFDSDKGVSISFDSNGIAYYFGNLEHLWVDVLNEIKYVHQLQNLYFALTGEELELKAVEDGIAEKVDELNGDHITVHIEKTDTGYSAYYKSDNGLVSSTGRTLTGLLANLSDAASIAED